MFAFGGRQEESSGTARAGETGLAQRARLGWQPCARVRAGCRAHAPALARAERRHRPHAAVPVIVVCPKRDEGRPVVVPRDAVSHGAAQPAALVVLRDPSALAPSAS
eukprot:6070729-Prymnesium_polylepis.2